MSSCVTGMAQVRAVCIAPRARAASNIEKRSCDRLSQQAYANGDQFKPNRTRFCKWFTQPFS